MKYVWISNAAPDVELSRCEKKYARHAMRFVQQWWDYGMASALYDYLGEQLHAISFPPVATFPSGKCLVYRGRRIRDEKGMEVDMLSAVNLPLIKQVWLLLGVFFRLCRICRKNKGEQIAVITHCIYPQSAIPAFWARRLFGIRVYTIVPDLPEHATAAGFAKSPMLKRIFGAFVSLSKRLNRKFDGYICFAEPQMEHLNREKPHIVMEGYIDPSLIDAIKAADPTPNRVMYAGGLMYRYGIRELVDGFVLAAIPGAELYVYGDGEAREYVLDKQDLGVFYGGCLSREQVIAQEKAAFLLVNPRPTKDEYSRCSFPSKLMEYMVTGTPVLTSRLGCIGQEYFDKMSFFEDISTQAVCDALKRCFADREAMIAQGARAADYVRQYKNAAHQAGVVVDFVSSNEGGK